LAEWVKGDDVIQPVQELWPEELLDLQEYSRARGEQAAGCQQLES
jgi:hypothetical protein